MVNKYKLIAYYATQMFELAFIVPQLLDEEKDVFYYRNLSPITILYVTRSEEKKVEEGEEGK